MPMKSVIHEKFGDGIMSAIDFTLTVDKENDQKGDRVIVTMNGKFLPYKKWQAYYLPNNSKRGQAELRQSAPSLCSALACSANG